MFGLGLAPPSPPPGNPQSIHPRLPDSVCVWSCSALPPTPPPQRKETFFALCTAPQGDRGSPKGQLIIVQLTIETLAADCRTKKPMSHGPCMLTHPHCLLLGFQNTLMWPLHCGPGHSMSEKWDKKRPGYSQQQDVTGAPFPESSP